MSHMSHVFLFVDAWLMKHAVYLYKSPTPKFLLEVAAVK